MTRRTRPRPRRPRTSASCHAAGPDLTLANPANAPASINPVGMLTAKSSASTRSSWAPSGTRSSCSTNSSITPRRRCTLPASKRAASRRKRVTLSLVVTTAFTGTRVVRRSSSTWAAWYALASTTTCTGRYWW